MCNVSIVHAACVPVHAAVSPDRRSVAGKDPLLGGSWYLLSDLVMSTCISTVTSTVLSAVIIGS